MRLHNLEYSADINGLREFSDWIERVGVETDYRSEIEIPNDLLLHCGDDPIETIVNSIYPEFRNKMNDHNYLQESSDRSCMSDSNFDVHTLEFLNTLKCSGVPDHEITLKIGTPVMLLINIDHSNGLCNGTRLVITRLRDKIIEAMVLTGSSAGELALIPRLSLTPSDTRFKDSRAFHL
ncbi:hypothetical protein ACS0TY_010826 [Phlomoides rotata]